MRYSMHQHSALAFSVYLVGLTTPVRAQRDSNMAVLECSPSTQAGFDFQYFSSGLTVGNTSQVEPAAGMTLHWSLSPSLEAVSFHYAITAELPGWISIGFSSGGDMVGSDAVVAFPTQGTVLEYDLEAKMSLLNQPSPLQEITETAVEKAADGISLTFSRPTTPVGEGKLPLLADADAPTIIIWAFGTSETFDYHFPKGRGVFSLDLLCSAVTSRKKNSKNAPGRVSVTPSPLVSAVEHFTASPSASWQTPYGSNGGAVLKPFGLSTRNRIRTVGVAGAMFVGVCTFLLATTGLFK